MPPIDQAQPQINAIYDPAVLAIQSQVPAIQQLYQSLIGGLQAQSQTQIGNVVNSAAQRGVSSAGITQGAQQALGDTLALQSAQLGSQQAQDVAGLQQQVGKANVGRASAISDLATALQKQNIENQTNQSTMSNLERQYALKQQQNVQNYNVQEAQAQAAAARAAARAAKDQVSESDLQRALRIGLNDVKGKDGHVSPKDLASAFVVWQQQGFSPESFWKNYQGLWNPNQSNYADQFYYHVNKGG